MNATLPDQTVSLPTPLPQPGLRFDVTDLGSTVVVVQIRGEATDDQAAHLHARLSSSLRPYTRFVILDLAGLTFADSSAVQTLADYSRDLRREGGEVWLTGLRPAVWLALHTARLDRLFTIRASLEEAMAG